MSPKAQAKKPISQKAQTSEPSKNGEQTPDEQLVRANKAMAKAWNLIARRQGKSA